MMNIQNPPRFSAAHAAEFQKELRNRVEEYFKSAKLSTKGNGGLYFKAATMFALYFVPFVALFFVESYSFLWWACWFAMGLGMAGLGMNVMHDANHGSFHAKESVNKWFGRSLYLISGNVFTWKVQHNVLHHTYTNVFEWDEDVDTNGLIRFHAHDKWRPWHRLQAFYAPILYGLLTLNWALLKDFNQLKKYHSKGFTKRMGTSLNKEFRLLLINKVVYLGLFLVLPLVVFSAQWYWVLLGWGLMHFTAGVILSFVFQLAHVVPGAEQEHPISADNMLEHSWMVHQLQTTADFGKKNKLLTWFLGGLNFQVEHHLFPHISHVHYPALAPIVEQTAKEYGVVYHSYTFFVQAVADHIKMLQELGNPRVRMA